MCIAGLFLGESRLKTSLPLKIGDIPAYFISCGDKDFQLRIRMPRVIHNELS